MGVRPSKAVRDQRAKVLEPLFAQMRLQRMSNRYVADKLGIPEKRFWAYQHGETRIPATFIAQVCEVVGLVPSLIPIPEPRERYLQQPPKKKAKQSGKKRTSSGNGRRRQRSDGTLGNSGAGGAGSGDATVRRSRRTQHQPQNLSQAGADDLPPGRASRRVARQSSGLTVTTDLRVMSSSLANDL